MAAPIRCECWVVVRVRCVCRPATICTRILLLLLLLLCRYIGRGRLGSSVDDRRRAAPGGCSRGTCKRLLLEADELGNHVFCTGIAHTVVMVVRAVMV